MNLLEGKSMSKRFGFNEPSSGLFNGAKPKHFKADFLSYKFTFGSRCFEFSPLLLDTFPFSTSHK